MKSIEGVLSIEKMKEKMYDSIGNETREALLILVDERKISIR